MDTPCDTYNVIDTFWKNRMVYMLKHVNTQVQNSNSYESSSVSKRITFALLIRFSIYSAS